jgi:hypothetical protein
MFANAARVPSSAVIAKVRTPAPLLRPFARAHPVPQFPALARGQADFLHACLMRHERDTNVFVRGH